MFRCNPRGNADINKNELAPGEYTLVVNYSRTHICSCAPDDNRERAIKFDCQKPPEGREQLESKVGKNNPPGGNGNCAQPIIPHPEDKPLSYGRPGDTLNWLHLWDVESALSATYGCRCGGHDRESRSGWSAYEMEYNKMSIVNKRKESVLNHSLPHAEVAGPSESPYEGRVISGKCPHAPKSCDHTPEYEMVNMNNQNRRDELLDHDDVNHRYCEKIAIKETHKDEFSGDSYPCEDCAYCSGTECKDGGGPRESEVASSKWACVDIPYHYPGYGEPDPECGGNKPPDTPPSIPPSIPPGTPPINPPDNVLNVKPTTQTDYKTVELSGSVKFKYNILNKKGPTKTIPMDAKVYTYLVRGDAYKDVANINTQVGAPGSLGCNRAGVQKAIREDEKGNPKCLEGADGQAGVVIKPANDHKWESSGPIYIDREIAYYNMNFLGKPGDYICSHVVVNNWSVRNNKIDQTEIASNVACTKIGKRPQIQIHGADSYATNGFRGAQHSGRWRMRGSYSQYGLLTGQVAPIEYFGSAGYSLLSSAPATGGDLSANNPLLWQLLAFANKGKNVPGNAGMDRMDGISLEEEDISQPRRTAQCEKLGSIREIEHMKPGSYCRTIERDRLISGHLTINNNLTVPAGVHLRLFIDGDLTINGNIDAPAPDAKYDNLGDMPSLIIKANNINISNKVSQISGTYIAEGVANTCPEGDRPERLGLSDGRCNENKLKVYGAIISKGSPILRRTFGSGNVHNKGENNQSEGEYASSSSEQFNYTPNNWLGPYLHNGKFKYGFKTVKIDNLPVRL